MNEQTFCCRFKLNFSTAESRGAFLSLQQPRCCVEISYVLMACLRFAGAFCNLPGVISLRVFHNWRVQVPVVL